MFFVFSHYTYGVMVVYLTAQLCRSYLPTGRTNHGLKAKDDMGRGQVEEKGGVARLQRVSWRVAGCGVRFFDELRSLATEGMQSYYCAACSTMVWPGRVCTSYS